MRLGPYLMIALRRQFFYRDVVQLAGKPYVDGPRKTLYNRVTVAAALHAIGY